MSSQIVTEAPIDSRVSGVWPEPEAQPAPPLRLTMGPFSEEDELRNMRIVIRAYVQRHGADVVRQAVEQIAAGAL